MDPVMTILRKHYFRQLGKILITDNGMRRLTMTFTVSYCESYKIFISLLSQMRFLCKSCYSEKQLSEHCNFIVDILVTLGEMVSLFYN